jgi:ribosomal-protein-alanine N-acetyltransferase
MPAVRLETPRLVLCIAQPDDAPRLLAYAKKNLDHHSRWAADPPAGFFTEAFWRTRQAQAHEGFARGQTLKLTLFARDDLEGPLVGQINFFDFIRGPVQQCQLGYSLDEDHVRKGLMQEGLHAALGFVFEELQLHRVRATYSPLNERSASVLRRMGFVIEGYMRDYLWSAGKWHDQVLVGRMCPDPARPPRH